MLSLLSDHDGREVKTMEKQQKLLKVADVAERLGLSIPHTYRIAAKGEIPCVRIGGAVRFEPKNVEEFIREHRRKKVKAA
jgi:excisionase family DNA binding protein